MDADPPSVSEVIEGREKLVELEDVLGLLQENECPVEGCEASDSEGCAVLNEGPDWGALVEISLSLGTLGDPGIEVEGETNDGAEDFVVFSGLVTSVLEVSGLVGTWAASAIGGVLTMEGKGLSLEVAAGFCVAVSVVEKAVFIGILPEVAYTGLGEAGVGVAATVGVVAFVLLVDVCTRFDGVGCILGLY